MTQGIPAVGSLQYDTNLTSIERDSSGHAWGAELSFQRPGGPLPLLRETTTHSPL